MAKSPFKLPVIETVIARYDDPRDGFCLGIVIEHEAGLKGEAVINAVKAAVRDYADTDAGKADENIKKNRFDYGDFVNSVPDRICVRHGFRVTDTFVTRLVVDHDEILT